MSEQIHTADPRTGSLAPIVHADMPRLRSELAQLVAIPSISATGYPAETHPPLLEAYEGVVALCRDAGVQINEPLSCRTPPLS